MTRTFNLCEAKTNLSSLVERAAAGEEVVIAKVGKPMVRLVPFAKRLAPRRPGLLKDEIELGPDFELPLPAKIQASFDGKSA